MCSEMSFWTSPYSIHQDSTCVGHSVGQNLVVHAFLRQRNVWTTLEERVINVLVFPGCRVPPIRMTDEDISALQAKATTTILSVKTNLLMHIYTCTFTCPPVLLSVVSDRCSLNHMFIRIAIF